VVNRLHKLIRLADGQVIIRTVVEWLRRLNRLISDLLAKSVGKF
jgi:hypothetical protein